MKFVYVDSSSSTSTKSIYPDN